MTWQVSRAVPIPVIGIGGITCANDVLEFMIAGARAVQIGTANFADPGVYDRVLADLRAYLERHRIDDINALVGTLDFPGAAPAPARG
jgi:dihydroorotate dehydrogenase (NAD+) catalytic subunit